MEEFFSLFDAIQAKYACFSRFSLGNSIEGREITAFSFGKGHISYLLVGSHHGSEWITTFLCVRILEYLGQKWQNNRSICGVSRETYENMVKITIIPVLNPDGVNLARNGAVQNSLLAERQLRINGGSADFHHWQANARGVDLNRNYNALWAKGMEMAGKMGITSANPTRFGGPFPESEPETRALCDFCRKERPRLAVALHSQGEEIYYDFNRQEPRISYPLAQELAKMTGYQVAKPEEIASCAGFKDWFLQEIGNPAFTIECGKGNNPLPISQLEEITNRLTEPLLKMPLLLPRA